MADSRPAVRLAGVFPVLATTFLNDGTLDVHSQLRLVDYLLEQGAHGLGLFGNASEGYALTAGERRSLHQEIAKHVAGRVPLVVSSGANGTYAAVEASREAEDLGADALMVLPPYFLKTDADGLLHYFSEIGNAVRIPIMVQDAPLMTQVAMPAALLARLHREIPHVQLVKVEAPPTAPKISEIRRLAGDGLIVFGGLNGQFFIEEVQRGSAGVMPGSDMADTYVAIWNLLRDRRIGDAWEIFARALPLIRFELQPGMGVSAMKHDLVAKGIIRSAFVRHPTVSLPPESIAELKFLREWIGCALAVR
ncbi:MAG TPA: dihydrodipicolinate synthase family protein [Bryobacteraceae bacterium]|nr:dihydrodipicolinate synthase family protein [Bryobacteraceae bacterium]